MGSLLPGLYLSHEKVFLSPPQRGRERERERERESDRSRDLIRAGPENGILNAECSGILEAECSVNSLRESPPVSGRSSFVLIRENVSIQ